jgi:hypothetical protein
VDVAAGVDILQSRNLCRSAYPVWGWDLAGKRLFSMGCFHGPISYAQEDDPEALASAAPIQGHQHRDANQGEIVGAPGNFQHRPPAARRHGWQNRFY